jgi:hypothetical protein
MELAFNAPQVYLFTLCIYLFIYSISLFIYLGFYFFYLSYVYSKILKSKFVAITNSTITKPQIYYLIHPQP